MKNRKREICTSGSVRDEDGQPPHLLGRRNFLYLAAGAAALPAFTRIVRAQPYPARPVRIIVGYPPGGTADVVARLIGQQLSERLGQPFVVENRPGAGTIIATEAVVKSAPDGYTLLVVDASPAINTTLYHNLNFFFFRDIAPVACVISVPLFMVVNPAVPAKTVPEFIAYAKANPRKVNMASNGNGGLLHLAGELFKMMTGVDLVHVPYRGAQPALTDVISGQVQVMIAASTVEYIKTGKVRALAVTTPTRSEVLPDVPPLSEFVPGYDAAAWIGVGAPKSPAWTFRVTGIACKNCLRFMAFPHELKNLPRVRKDSEPSRFWIRSPAGALPLPSISRKLGMSRWQL